jgi:hypothetical protein
MSLNMKDGKSVTVTARNLEDALDNLKIAN